MSDLSQLTRDEIAGLLGKHPATISKYCKKGFPRNPDGKTYPGQLCVAWSLEQIAETATKEKAETDESKHWLAKLRNERFLKARLERLEKEELLVPRERLKPFLTQIFNAFRNGLLNLRYRLPPVLENKKQISMHAPIKEETNLILEALSGIMRNGREFGMLPEEIQQLRAEMTKAYDILEEGEKENVQQKRNRNSKTAKKN